MEKTSTRDSRLVSYPQPATPVQTEHHLKMNYLAAKNLAILALILSVFLLLFIWMNLNLFFGYEIGPIVAWSYVGALALAITIMFGIALVFGPKSFDEREHFYKEVPQGKIVELTTAGGGETPLRWCVVLEGHNRLNQIRRQAHEVSAGKWHDGSYVVGEYADFS